MKTLIALGLGTVIGATLTFMLLCRAMVSGSKSKKLTKDEWKAGMRQK